MENLKSNAYSHLTAKERTALSFPAKYLLDKKLLTGDILDFGCGLGTDVELLSKRDFRITGYDPHYFPKYPTRKFDTIVCFYVLNVLMQEEQANVLMNISKLLKPAGKAFFAVRRDLRFEGFRMHKVHQKPTYQCNVKLGYKSIFKNESCEIYEYRHFNQITHKDNSNCPFCNPNSDRELIVESATAYAIYDKYPVSEGHALIIPKRHCANFFDLTFRDQSACIFMLNQVKEILNEKFHPHGYNVGINVNSSAGQTISHAHIH